MATAGSKSYKRRRGASSGAGPKSGGSSSAGSGAGAGGGVGGSSSSPPPPSPYEGLPTEEALSKIGSDANVLVPKMLRRLCQGLPRTELELMCAEAAECERALREEIRILDEEVVRLRAEEEGGAGANKSGGETKKEGGGADGESDAKKRKADGAGAASSSATSAASPLPPAPPPVDPSLPEVKPAIGDSSHFSTADEMLSSELTPPDRYFTVSALLGRLRDPLDTPLPPNSALGPLRESQRAAIYRKGLKKGASDAEKREAERRYKERQMERQRALLALESNPVYARKLDDLAPLLACWKRISNHRSAAVFRKAVNPREAPGYTERILFPIDLASIRKTISAGHVDSFVRLHRRIGLICHNCVKYNGRESDYGLVAREFESYADDAVIDAVGRVTDAEAAAAAKAAAAATAAAAASRSAAAASAIAPAGGGTMPPPPPPRATSLTAAAAAPTTVAGAAAAAPVVPASGAPRSPLPRPAPAAAAAAASKATSSTGGAGAEKKEAAAATTKAGGSAAAAAAAAEK